MIEKVVPSDEKIKALVRHCI